MIAGQQPKVLLSQTMTGTLVRERDGLTHSGRIGFIEWMPDGRFKELYLEPQVGFSIIVDPHRLSYTWMTTPITSMKQPTENTYEFETENSKYKLTFSIQLGV